MPHELLAPTDNQPGIVVHVCDDGGNPNNGQNKRPIARTECPKSAPTAASRD